MTDTPSLPPADHAVRERIINELDTSFFLEAGAGSGKTSVIVGRVVNLVRHGRSLDEIVAITFTEKAAGELRERIRAELASAGLHEALRDVDAAQIQTIHAFAANILRERSLDAGLDPDFSVLDQLQADLRFAQSWRSWLWSNDAPQQTLQRALDLGLPLRDLQLAAEQLARNRDLTGDRSDIQPSEEVPEDQRERDIALNDLTSALREFIEQEADRRRTDGVLSYDDLLLEARELLVRSKAARETCATGTERSWSMSSRTPIRCKPRSHCCWPPIQIPTTGHRPRPDQDGWCSPAIPSSRSTAFAALTSTSTSRYGTSFARHPAPRRSPA